ncbi:U4/U6-U5 snRNP complex subunit SPP381 KNAG_0K02040 [Huiozyma naganishii CBS 8797]|uniref:Pre-mRNA-splicing factor SPP381 n=1 Tax=Huiozyma naganishii (strain ATCC MYA-139 / BCRC 22969 / CBS 8797 / KCTC 17520 / NBRC 10181 / NCYC 3082 / Yp74L-3) TaxID=1071383 RepID=J7RRT3_HUIN7|nr:hypothetical protein KNAG_0K02040 [Kazachstania naganishii CBS 8797]CCK72568.1 hypothetical protein KNAG_0K02040 [Kazachstania naganishii CBS 8797]
MAIKRVVREGTRSGITSGSSRSSQPDCAQDAAESEDDFHSSSAESSSEEDASSSEQEVMYHKPVLLKRAAPVTTPEEKTFDTQQRSTRERLQKRVEHQLHVSKTQESRKLNIDENYTTDKDLLRQIVQLNDDDTLNAEQELKDWQERQARRLQRNRDALVKTQLEAEERQARVMERAAHKGGGDPVNDTNSVRSTPPQVTGVERKTSPFKKRSQYKPQKPQDMTFDTVHSTRDGPASDKNNEYSAL